MSENDKLIRGWWSIPGSGITVMRSIDPYADFMQVFTDPHLQTEYKTNPSSHDTRYPRPTSGG